MCRTSDLSWLNKGRCGSREVLHTRPRLPKKHHVFYTIFSLIDVPGRRKRGGCLRAARASPAPDNGNHPARPYPDLSGADASLMHFHWAPWLYSAISLVGLRSGGDRRRQGVRMRPPAAGRVLSCLQQGSVRSRGASGEGIGATRLPLPLRLPLPDPAAQHRRSPPLR